MTMPFERTRALRWAGDFLRELVASNVADEAMKREITVILRHYPSPSQLNAWVKGCGSKCDWLGREFEASGTSQAGEETAQPESCRKHASTCPNDPPSGRQP